MSDWLYQIRIKVSEQLSADLRSVNDLGLSKAVSYTHLTLPTKA